MTYRPLLTELRNELEVVTDPVRREIMQFERVSAIIAHAYARSSFHRARMEAAGFRPDQFKELADLKRIPVFEKCEILDTRHEIKAAGFNEKDLVLTATGGTTGNSFRFWRDPECHARRHTLAIAANAMYGWHPGDSVALVWNARHDLSGPGRRELWGRLVDWLGWRTLEIDATRLDETALIRWHDLMKSREVEVVYGYARSIKAIADHLLATGKTLPSVRLVVTTAEPLYEADREAIAGAFECVVRDRYASREAGPMAQEDDSGFLSYFANSVFLEIDAEPGEIGDILVTDLWNRAFPFIRYRIGDTARMPQQPNGVHGLPVLGSLTGRETDFLVAADDSLVSGMTLHAAYENVVTNEVGSTDFRQLQFSQRTRESVVVRIVPGPTFDRESCEARLVALVRSLLGEAILVDFEYLDEIPRSASGKYRFTVNEMGTP